MYELIKMPNYTQFFEEKVRSDHPKKFCIEHTFFKGLPVLVTQTSRTRAKYDQLKTFSKEKFYFHLELGFIRHEIFRHLRCPLVCFHQLFIVGPHNLQRYNFLHTRKQANYFLLQTILQEERD